MSKLCSIGFMQNTTNEERVTSRVPSRKTLSFLDFPREIRDAIYEFALISSSPILAWTGLPLSELENNFDRINTVSCQSPEYLDMPTYFKDSLVVERFAPSLFLCNSTVSQEAAIIFYRHNTFRFIGDHRWSTIVQWLRGIGARNRAFLTKLEVSFKRPQRVWQLGNGARTPLDIRWDSHGENAREQVYNRSRHLSLDPESVTSLEGIVENISPDLETVFELLGACPAGPTATIILLVDYRYLPGAQIWMDEQHPYGTWVSMDIPNVMERCRQLHTTDGSKHIEILWKCMNYKVEFELGIDMIEERGWEILEILDGEPQLYHDDFPEEVYVDTFFTIRRKHIAAGSTIVADAPSPHSWRGC